MKRIIYSSVVVLAFTCSPLLANTLTVTVKENSSKAGEIRAALFNKADGFPKETVYQRRPCK
ncbi:hypothetical protein MNBD_GAMMA17-398 [hydrothermal vent metagenome]|uniref:Uncharacterized protein n=1 Tax=hydrothermal vent metagenome TaxID=652676 RepID=A0A3B0ZKG6_9ZZZZ